MATGVETSARAWIGALRRSQDRLAPMAGSLSADELAMQSACAEWTVAQVLSHLGSGAELALRWLDAAIAHETPPGPEAFPAVWEAWGARRPAEQAADAVAYNERHVARLESLDDDELAAAHVTLFGLELDGGGLARIRLGEHTVHTWDIAVAFDPSAVLPADAVTLLVDSLPLLATRTGRPATADEAWTVLLRTTDPERELLLRVSDAVTLEPIGADALATGEGAPAALTLPAEVLVRLVYGRTGTDDVPTADADTFARVRAVFPGL
jgi:uncharacterized protein (TIGR03083 family)